MEFMLRVKYGLQSLVLWESLIFQLKSRRKTTWGMGVVTVSSSAARSPLGLIKKLSSNHSGSRSRPSIVAFKADKSNSTALILPQEQILLPVEAPKKQQKRLRKSSKVLKNVKAVSTDEASPCILDVDYNEAAAKLESIYKLSPSTKTSDVGDVDSMPRRERRRRRRISGDDDKADNEIGSFVVRNPAKRAKRLSLDKRIALGRDKNERKVAAFWKKSDRKNENEKIEELVREYSASTDLVSLDWKKMKIPPVLSSTEHAWLFKLMQPMKVFLFSLFPYFLNFEICIPNSLAFLCM